MLHEGNAICNDHDRHARGGLADKIIRALDFVAAPGKLEHEILRHALEIGVAAERLEKKAEPVDLQRRLRGLPALVRLPDAAVDFRIARLARVVIRDALRFHRQPQRDFF